jgi:RNA polymerase sigma factor (sigma-70 family)
MGTQQMSAFFRRLARGTAAATMGDQSDGELVERFLASRDDTVFEVIVRRHGPMIFRVCWRVLQDEQEAEDALQATFLVLAQKLHTVRKRTSLASWLHGVAHRVALKAKAQVASRQRHERQASVSGAVPSDEVTWKELRSVLDAELERMPEKWRLPLILCYLEGRTQDEAAAQLECGERTLRRRLDEARAALRRRLSGRGIVWPAPWCAVLLSECVAPATMKLGVIRSTVEISANVLAGQATTAVVPSKVAALAEGVMKAMFINKLEVVAAMFLALGVLAAGTSAVVLSAAPSNGPAAGVFAKDAAPKMPVQDNGLRHEAEDKRETPADAGAKNEKPPADAPKTPPGKEADKPKTDNERLQGTWEWVSLTQGGKTIKEENLLEKDGRPGTLKFVGDKVVSADFNTGGKVVESKGSFKLDPSRKPKEIDLTPEDGEHKDKTISCVYELEGDSLGLCFPGQPGQERPTKLESKEGDSYMLMTYKRAATARAEKVLKLEGPVTSVLWSPDGKLMTVVAMRQEKAKDGDKERPFDYFTTVRIHDANTGKENVSLGEVKNANQVHRMFAPDGKTLAISIRKTIQEGDKVELWDAEKGKLLRTIKMDYGRAHPRLAFSPDSKQLAVAFGGPSSKVTGGARVFDTKTGDLIQGLTGHKSLVLSVCFSPDGKTLATGGDSTDREIYLWNTDKPLVEPRILEGLKGSAWCVTFSPDGKTLAGSDTEGGARLWDVETGKEKAALPDNGGYCSLVAFTRDGRLLLGAGRVEKEGKQSGEVRVWDVKTEKLLLKVENTTESAAFSPDDRTLSVLIRGTGIRMMNLAHLVK